MNEEARLRRRYNAKKVYSENLLRTNKDLASEIVIREATNTELKENMAAKEEENTNLLESNKGLAELITGCERKIRLKEDEIECLKKSTKHIEAQARKYRLAFATAFKVVNELSSKVTMRDILSNTDKYLDAKEQTSDTELPARKRPRYESPPKPSVCATPSPGKKQLTDGLMGV